MGTGKDDLKAIMNGDKDFADKETEKNYQALRAMLISAKRHREGSFDIDYLEASDLAFDLATQLPKGVRVLGVKEEIPEEKEPSWLLTFSICAIILSIAAMIYIVGTYL